MDAIWLPPVFMHGPIRWGRTGLMGSRIAYGVDVCGNYDRVASHCKFFGDHRGQGGLDRKPHFDPNTALTHQAADSPVFSQGSIVNWGMYNMTEMWLSFVTHHDDWTGDDDFLRSVWPAIRDAVAFEKRVFDMDGDSLYENYANTYITDAHWHNGGNCTQASSYVFRGNRLAARAARLAGESPQPYLDEADRIRAAMNRVLWLPKKGIFAEWKDILGNQLLHTDPELGSIYLPIDCGVADQFQAYQMLRFTEWGLPNHEFEERGPQPFDGIYRKGATYEFPQTMKAREVKSSNWRPIILSCYECSPGELMDTARCYYRLGYNDRAFPLVKAVLRCMVNLSTVGGLVIRDRNGGQFLRSWGNYDIDHADTLGSSLQCLAEGLFGIHPHMREKTIDVQPGFPADWNHAQIELRDISYTFRRQGNTETYRVTSSRPTTKRLRVLLRGDGVTALVDGQPVAKPTLVSGIGHAFVVLESPESLTSEFSVTYDDRPLPKIDHPPVVAQQNTFAVVCSNGKVAELKDPQGIFASPRMEDGRFQARVVGGLGHHTAFLRVACRTIDIWFPVDVEIRPALEIVNARLAADATALSLEIRNNAQQAVQFDGKVQFGGQSLPVSTQIGPSACSQSLSLKLPQSARIVPGLNRLSLTARGGEDFETTLECWDLLTPAPCARRRCNSRRSILPGSSTTTWHWSTRTNTVHPVRHTARLRPASTCFANGVPLCPSLRGAGTWGF